MEVRKTRTSFSSLENALRLLQLFSMDETELSITDISERLNISKSAAHRLLQTLKSEGFVKKRRENQSILPRCFFIGNEKNHSFPIPDLPDRSPFLARTCFAIRRKRTYRHPARH
ncbi:helix-turn-helix domain-containing protein [Geobacillus thermoleovorans]|uniref:helix-turn-helix domain-containing protein n=1 Tax=Geobacillus thermoleovorans TaxID=33941 RepID=UPI002989EE3F|nr:helix-turn-helix domain-containing protein [Geobacillus thermoleovorans]